MQDRWYFIDMIIKAYIKKYPLEWIQFNEEMKAIRNTRRDMKFASNKSGSMRWSASFPDNLWVQLSRHFPKLKKDKKIMAELLRKYPYFKTSEKY